jgi:hypothetical protein
MEYPYKYIFNFIYIGMASSTVQKTFYINSSEAFRDPSGTNEDFTITEYTARMAQTPKRVKLIKASIPYTWNNITSFNNTFSVLDPAPHVVTIPDGHYNGVDLAPVLQSAINASGVSQTYTVIFNTNTLKYTISSVGDFSLDFTDSNSAATQLGFNTDIVTLPAISVTSTDVAQLIPDYEVFICSDLVTGSDNGVMKWTSSPPTSDEILATVPITGCFGGLITYITTGEPFFTMAQSAYAQPQEPGPYSPRTMRFFLRFPSGIPVELNGLHWTAQLVFEF